MRFFYLLFYVIFVYSKPPSRQYRNFQRTNGYDQRPNIAEPDIYETVHKIHGFFEKKLILDKLQNPMIPLHMKLSLIDNHQVASVDKRTQELSSLNPNGSRRENAPNLFAGGLMRDFDFEFDSFLEYFRIDDQMESRRE
jgi:hypothetical protein